VTPEINEANRFWHGRTPADRIAALQLMRELIYGDDARSSRIERVFEIVEGPDAVSEFDKQGAADAGDESKRRLAESLVEELLKETLEGDESCELTPQDWADMRSEARRRINAR